MTITIGEIVSILLFLGAIISVWVRNEVSVAKLTERVLANEKQQNISDLYNTKALEKFENMLTGQLADVIKELKELNKKISWLESQVHQKADKQ